MLEIVAKNHKLWVRMVINMGCDPSIAEDIVQEMYIRLHRLVKDGKRIMYNNEEVNRFFIFVTLRNMFVDYTKARNKYQFFSFLENDTFEKEASEVVNNYEDVQEHQAFEAMISAIKKEMSNWSKYDRLLCEIYFKSDKSLRDLAEETGITLTSIYNSIKNYKTILASKFGEDWEDYINKDYHLLK